MALKITEDCINCGACEAECPNNAIREGEPVYIIDPALCTECYGFHATQQCADVCPVEACIADEAHADSRENLAQRFEKLYPDRPMLNTSRWKPPLF
ncbi:MAG: YfhL family 4Fe-4S dicluster ferredoxin [Firmicutes bacterium]|nr:YfhL family 4Fe-4S dicluster ferredoxin [Bacillota bacterium]